MLSSEGREADIYGAGTPHPEIYTSANNRSTNKYVMQSALLPG